MQGVDAFIIRVLEEAELVGVVEAESSAADV